MAERIDIVITDKVSPEPAKKLRQLAASAIKADSAIERLKASLAGIDDTAITRLTNASARLTDTQAREISATERLQRARARTVEEVDRAATSSQRLATEQAKTQTATNKAGQASTKARAALSAEETASLRLTAAKNRLAAAQNKVTTASRIASRGARGSASATQNSIFQTQNLIFQVQDIVTGLASGQKPLTVFIQQGLQIQGIFGPGTGIIGILRGVALATAAMIAPFLPIIAVVSSIAAGFGVLTNEVSNTTDVAVSFGDVVRASMQLATESIVNFLQPAIAAIGPYFTSAFTTAYNYVITITRTLVNSVTAAFVGTYNAITGLWGQQFPILFESAWKTAFNAYLDGLQSLTNTVLTVFRDQINAIVRLYAGAFNSIVGLWQLLPPAFERLFSIAFNTSLTIVQNSTREVIRALDNVLTYIGSAVELIGRENPFADLLDPSTINLEQYQRIIAPVGPSIAETVSKGFRDAFSRDYVTAIRDSINLNQYKQEISEEAQGAANIVENAYRDAFSTDFAGGTFNAIRQQSIQIAQERIAAEAKNEEITSRGNVELTIKEKLLRNILKPLVDYRESSAALNKLLGEGLITVGQYNEALASLSLVRSLRDVDSTLQNTSFSDQSAIDEIRIAQQERLNIVQDSLKARIISEEQAAARVTAINRQASEDIQAIELARQSIILTSAMDTFASLSEVAKGFAGDQSRIYQVLFVASKAFAIADSIIKIQQGIANALSGPFPANLVAASTVAAQAANIVASIQAVQFADGGRVSGPGGSRDDQILARLSDGEFVVNAEATRRNLALLQAINNGRDQIRYVPAFRDGGQVEQSTRFVDHVSRIGNDNVPQPNNVNINIYTRDPNTRVEMSNAQQDTFFARRINNAQRNL